MKNVLNGKICILMKNFAIYNIYSFGPVCVIKIYVNWNHLQRRTTIPWDFLSKPYVSDQYESFDMHNEKCKKNTKDYFYVFRKLPTGVYISYKWYSSPPLFLKKIISPLQTNRVCLKVVGTECRGPFLKKTIFFFGGEK